MTKVKPRPWSYEELAAGYLWPNLASKELQAGMKAFARKQGKTDPLAAKARADQQQREQSQTKHRR